VEDQNLYAMIAAAVLAVVKLISALSKKKAKNKDSEVGDE